MEKRKRGRPSKKDKELYNKINNINTDTTTEVLEVNKLELTECQSPKEDAPDAPDAIELELLEIKMDNINTPRQLLELLKAVDFTITSYVSKERLEQYPELNQYIK